MAFLRTVGCDCEECGPDACTPACECTLSVFDSGSADYSGSVDLTGTYVPGNELMLNYSLGRCEDAGCEGRVKVWVDGVLVLDSGCTCGNLDPTGYVIEFPSGAALLEYEVTADCDPGFCAGSVYWSFSAECIDGGI